MLFISFLQLNKHDLLFGLLFLEELVLGGMVAPYNVKSCTLIQNNPHNLTMGKTVLLIGIYVFNINLYFIFLCRVR